MGGSLLTGPCMKPQVVLDFLAFMDVVDQILWSTIPAMQTYVDPYLLL